METTTGTLADRFPYTRIGTGGRPLVVLPGLVLDNATPGRSLARAYGWSMRRLAEGRTLHIIQRPHGLPAGAGTADIAAEYAALLRAEMGSTDVMGLSTGGLIAQHLALSHPDVVRRLALVVAGARIAPAGRELVTEWRRLADAGRWRALRGGMAAAAVDGPVARWFAHRFGGSGRAPEPRDLADFRTTSAADLVHDTTADLPALDRPTLVLGGAADPFFPEATLRATADAIPGATLRVRPGGHGVPKRHAGWLQAEVGAFLDGPVR
jgi:pimeloyl-ACP methyl ester carboxylesterase